MLPNIRASAVDERGFTLIELLVVILIIGILAAIAIPSFLNQRGKASDASAKATVRSAQTAEETVYTDGQLYVSQAVGAGAGGVLGGIEPSLISPSAACVGSPPYVASPCGLEATAASNSFTVSVTSKTGVVFTIIKSATGTVMRQCNVSAAVGGNGGCANVVANVGSW